MFFLTPLLTARPSIVIPLKARPLILDVLQVIVAIIPRRLALQQNIPGYYKDDSK
jgi:hypothetical protein